MSLSHVRQIGTLSQYLVDFERISNRIQSWPEEALIGTLINGFEEEITMEVQFNQLRTLTRAVDLAKMQDDWLVDKRR